MRSIAILTTLSLLLAAIAGWFINLVGVVQLALANAAVTTMFVAKIIGIFVAPLGAVLGLFF